MVEILEDIEFEEIYDPESLHSELKELEQSEIKTIVFDLGGVYFTDGSRFAIDKIKNFCKIKDLDLLTEVFSNDHGSDGRKIRLGKISMDEFERRACKKLGINQEDRHFIRHLWFGSYCPNYRMKKIVKILGKNHRLVIFSGNVRERIEYLDERYDFLKDFDDYVFSYDYQMNKRDMNFYEELLEHIECDPSQALLIDDSATNLNRAQSLGFKTIQYAYTEKFVEDLKEIGILLSA